jgi:hypothetical protein
MVQVDLQAVSLLAREIVQRPLVGLLICMLATARYRMAGTQLFPLEIQEAAKVGTSAYKRVEDPWVVLLLLRRALEMLFRAVMSFYSRLRA